MEKNIMIGILFEYYRDLLTEKQSDSIEMYYLEDLSITEIAENLGVSKQSISENLKRSEKALFEYEEKLGMYRRFNEIGEYIEKIDEMLIEDLDNETYSKYLDLIFNIKSKL